MNFKKFFDSGDYAMNQNKEKKIHPSVTPNVLQPIISIAPAQSYNEESIRQQPHKIQSQFPNEKSLSEEQSSQALSTLRPPQISCITGGGSIEANGDTDEESHLQIPRPDTVPQRKASILHPSVHSKLSPQPHIHHNDESITTILQ